MQQCALTRQCASISCIHLAAGGPQDAHADFIANCTIEDEVHVLLECPSITVTNRII
jgi:hypothetical protein